MLTIARFVRGSFALAAVAFVVVAGTSSVAEAHGYHHGWRDFHEGGGCNQYGCWNSPWGSCNQYGCRDVGGCNQYGCWDTPRGGCNQYGCWR
ncbi:MAG TPA: hypothetical protein VHB21_05670 [Minicystis sp.]|nr:hypothetical protein [Minicystis sp.]